MPISPLRQYPDRRDPLVWLLTAAAAICVLEFVRAIFTLGLRLPLNFNEGWNAYHAADVASGRPLYPDLSGQFFTNYPPLSFYVIAPIGRLLHDQMLAGRLVSLASLAAWIALVAATARRLRCSWMWARTSATTRSRPRRSSGRRDA